MTRQLLSLMPIFALLMSACAAHENHRETLDRSRMLPAVDNGRALAQIVIPPDADCGVVRFAAKEMQEILKRATGVAALAADPSPAALLAPLSPVLLGQAETQDQRITLERSPGILIQPEDRGVREGDNAVLFTAARGYPTPTYQWRRNGKELPGRSRPTLYLKAVARADEGEYDVVVTNDLGTAVSEKARLTVAAERSGTTYEVRPGADLTAAGDKLRAGDTLLLRGGTYFLHETGAIKLRSSGESWERPITIASCPGEKAIIDGTYAIEGEWEQFRGSIYKIDLGAVDPEKSAELRARLKIRMKHGTKGYNTSPSYHETLYQDGYAGEGRTLVRQYKVTETIDGGYSEDVVRARVIQNGEDVLYLDEPGEFVYDMNNDHLYVWLHGGGHPRDHTIRAPYQTNVCFIQKYPECDYLIVRDLCVRGVSGTAIGSWNSRDHMFIENLEVGYMGGQSGLGRDVIIINSCFHHGYYNAGQGGGPGFLFEGNAVSDMGNPEVWPHGIVGGECTGLNLSGGDHYVIRGNLFQDNSWAEGWGMGAAVVHETWGEKPGEPHGERQHHLVYESNVFANCDTGIAAQGRDIVHSFIVRNNVFMDSRRAGIFLWGDNRDHFIVDNVFCNNGSAVQFRRSGASRYLSGDDVPTYFPSGNVLGNNILIGNEFTIRGDGTFEGNHLIGNRHEDDNGTLQQLMEKAETAFGTEFYHAVFEELTRPQSLRP